VAHPVKSLKKNQTTDRFIFFSFGRKILDHGNAAQLRTIDLYHNPTEQTIGTLKTTLLSIKKACSLSRWPTFQCLFIPDVKISDAAFKVVAYVTFTRPSLA